MTGFSTVFGITSLQLLQLRMDLSKIFMCRKAVSSGIFQVREVELVWRACSNGIVWHGVTYHKSRCPRYFFLCLFWSTSLIQFCLPGWMVLVIRFHRQAKRKIRISIVFDKFQDIKLCFHLHHSYNVLSTFHIFLIFEASCNSVNA